MNTTRYVNFMNHLVAVGLVLAVGFLAAGCTSATAASSDGQDGLTRVDVGVLPIIDDAPLFIALRDGLFRAQGLDVTPVMLDSGEQATDELLSGKLQFAFSNYVTMILAASGGSKLRVVADGGQTLADTNVIMVAKNSPIQSVTQLRGKSIAVNAVGNIGSLMIDSTLETFGVPVKSVKLVVMPFPAMAAALQHHAVDAAWMSEPFVTESGEQIGAEELADTATGALANFPIAGYETLQSYAQQNPATVAAFQHAIVQAEGMAANRSVVEQALPTYITGMTPAIVSAVHMDSYPTSLSAIRLQRVADAMLSAGMLARPFNVQQLLSGG
jgi:NitT/TauT family transport system substrate-binding protein